MQQQVAIFCYWKMVTAMIMYPGDPEYRITQYEKWGQNSQTSGASGAVKS